MICYPTVMARYSLFVLKVPLNPKQTICHTMLSVVQRVFPDSMTCTVLVCESLFVDFLQRKIMDSADKTGQNSLSVLQLTALHIYIGENDRCG